MKNVRIYPLRTSSSIWKIKLYSKHICNNMCKYAYLQDDISYNSSIVFVIENPDYKDGKCHYSMKLNTSSVHINNFNKDDPNTIDGELLFYNNIVIPDTEIYIHISFPLKESKLIKIKSNNSLGFSLTNLLNKIKSVYKWIYEEEENTCSIKKFDIIDECNCSYEIDITEIEHMKEIKEIKHENEEKCSICLENIENQISKTKCNHLFHKNCIFEWVNNNKNTCPLCRKNLLKCLHNCKNGLIYKEYIGKVIPKNIRGILSRNVTDGIFGIYGYDLEDLFIDEMIYNSKTKILYPKIFG